MIHGGWNVSGVQMASTSLSLTLFVSHSAWIQFNGLHTTQSIVNAKRKWMMAKEDFPMEYKRIRGTLWLNAL